MTVVEQRSYSRNCASTSWEAETWTLGQLGAEALGDRALVAGLEVGEQQADRDGLGARVPRGLATRRSSRLSARAASTTPSGPTRSGAAIRSSSGTSGAAFGAHSR